MGPTNITLFVMVGNSRMVLAGLEGPGRGYLGVGAGQPLEWLSGVKGHRDLG